MVLPWIFYQEIPESDADMGDLEFIEGKVIAGDYFQVSGDINALNDTIEFDPASGKTAFLIKAKIIISNHPLTARLLAQVAAPANIVGQTHHRKLLSPNRLRSSGRIRP